MNPRLSMNEMHGNRSTPRAKALAGEGTGSVQNHDYSNGRRTSYRLTEYFEFYLRAKAETEERNQARKR
jgi:hypothetical protein